MTAIDIEYCVPCGHRQHALRTADHLLEAFGRELDFVRLTPGDGGVFRIRADDETIFDTNVRGYDIDEIVRAVRERTRAQN